MRNNIQIVQELYEAFARKDSGLLRQLLHPDVEWIQCEGFPGGDRRRGVAEVLDKVFGGLRSEWSDFRAIAEEYLDSGDKIVALGCYSGTHAVSGKSMSAVFAHVYDVADGKVTRFRQFTDTQPMIDAMQR
jgi:ketosteroid isomerase-like protein